MTIQKPTPGTAFPSVTVPQLGGGVMTLGQSRDGYDWKLIVVYRGKHCPVCTRYLKELDAIVPQLKDLRIDVAAVSCRLRPEHGPDERAGLVYFQPTTRNGY
jgi:peroxiredoxin